MPKPILLLALIAAGLTVLFDTGSFLLTALTVLFILIAGPVIRAIRKNLYFASERFRSLKEQTASVVSGHNEIANYVSEIRTLGSFGIGVSSSGQYAHLASFENTSVWNNRRDRNVADYAPQVHNASLQVVRSAKADPIKYVMKYFSIKADQRTLIAVQRVAEDVSRLQEAIANVKDREADIAAKIDPPAFILKHYNDQFWDQVGVQLPPIEVPYPQYKFQYISPGGNSSQETTIKLNTQILEGLSATLVDKIRWSKSAAGQRALMTASLRTFIKERDNYTCMNCGISVAAEPHLLLEIDHIIPVSKGGLSVPENLRALCWKCNRAKGARQVSEVSIELPRDWRRSE